MIRIVVIIKGEQSKDCARKPYMFSYTTYLKILPTEISINANVNKASRKEKEFMLVLYFYGTDSPILQLKNGLSNF